MVSDAPMCVSEGEVVCHCFHVVIRCHKTVLFICQHEQKRFNSTTPQNTLIKVQHTQILTAAFKYFWGFNIQIIFDSQNSFQQP